MDRDFLIDRVLVRRRLFRNRHVRRMRLSFATPDKAPESFLINFTQVKETLQSNIDRGAMTITKFMAEKQLEGGVSLDSTTDTSASQILTVESSPPEATSFPSGE